MDFIVGLPTTQSGYLELLCFGMNLEKIKSLDQKYFEKQKGKFKSSERT
jgi:hypothetical protein